MLNAEYRETAPGGDARGQKAKVTGRAISSHIQAGWSLMCSSIAWDAECSCRAEAMHAAFWRLGAGVARGLTERS
jgi:hypothetical protein